MRATLPPYISRTVWIQAYQSLNWLQGVLSTATDSHSLATKAGLVLDSITAGATIISIYDLLLPCASLLSGVQQAGSLPVVFTPQQSAAISATISTLATLPGVVSSLVPNSFPSAEGSLNAGNPSMYLGTSNPDLVSTLLGFYPESPPATYDGSWGSLQSNAVSLLGTWSSIVDVVSGYYGNFPEPPLDSVIRINQGLAACVSTITGISADIASSYLSPQITWNQMVAVPRILNSCRISSYSASTNPSQSNMVARAFLRSMSMQLAQFIVVANGVVSTANGSSTVSQEGQGLMDIASQNLGDFEKWQGLVGSLPPPWGAGSIPTGTVVSLQPGSQANLAYAQILGTDIELGSQNQPMPQWSGDFNVAIGVRNYAEALGRRLATTLGSLVYHPLYGSRIPPEVGNVESNGAAALICAFGQSAILSDPRTDSVVSASATSISGNTSAIAFQATVKPVGPGTTAVTLNEVITGGQSH